MLPISIQEYNSFKSEIDALASAFVSDAHRKNGDHIYDQVIVKLRKPFEPRQQIVAHLILEMAVEYHDPYGDEPFDDEYRFEYALYDDGRIGRIHPGVPETQEQVFREYRAWGRVICDWVKDIKAHYNLKARKERFAPIYEELAAKMWHPDRIAGLLETGGWDAIEGI